jgi:hypothetical protein
MRMGMLNTTCSTFSAISPGMQLQIVLSKFGFLGTVQLRAVFLHGLRLNPEDGGGFHLLNIRLLSPD